MNQALQSPGGHSIASYGLTNIEGSSVARAFQTMQLSAVHRQQAVYGIKLYIDCRLWDLRVGCV